jgi:DNA-binding response OmpR family regulator
VNTILIIDDDPVTRKYVSHLLSVGGYKVEMAADGREAILKARKDVYDLAVVDLVLPGELNGMDIIRNLKSISPTTKLIAFTAFSGSSLSTKTATAGADAFISKSYISEQLLTTINRLLGLKPGERITEDDDEMEDEEESVEEEETPDDEDFIRDDHEEYDQPEQEPADTIEKIETNDEEIETEEPLVENIPKVFHGLPNGVVAGIMELGKNIHLKAGNKYPLRYTMEVGLVLEGKAQCVYQDRVIFTLQQGDSIGEESFFLSDDPDFKIRLESDRDMHIMVIPKQRLEDFFAEQEQTHFIMFQTNVILSLSRKLTKYVKQKSKAPIAAVRSIKVEPDDSNGYAKNEKVDLDLIEILHL